MGVSHGSNRVSDLGLRVYATTVHPDWFTTRVHRRVIRSNWEADLRVIHGGHVVTWRSGPSRITEVVCVSDLELPPERSLFTSSFRRERSTRIRPERNLEYQVNLGAERVSPELFCHLCDEFALDAKRGALFHRHGASNRLFLAPLTSLSFDFVKKGLSIQTFHTFPEENAIIRTQSLFEIT